MEEYVARLKDCGDLFFMWQVGPSVVFGRNQPVAAEVNVDYCRDHDIRLFRRKSGGGCIYADKGNVMMSYVTDGEDVNLAFNRFVTMMLLVLRKLGLEAVGTTHNDIMIGQHKVSGTACYHLPGRSIVHGTMLYDTDMDNMLAAITPSQAKMSSKGIKSVRQRITLLKDHLSIGLDELIPYVRQTLCVGELVLSETDVATIEQLEKSYLDEAFIYSLP
jgi:lipoic acid synthetase/lipoate-protein ligase A